MLYAFVLLAQAEKVAEKVAEKGAANEPSLLSFLMPFFLIAIAFYFMIVVPGKRERQNRMKLISELKKNDEVLTSAGIYGVVHSIKDDADEVTLKIDDNARIRVLKSSIVTVIKPKETSIKTP